MTLQYFIHEEVYEQIIFWECLLLLRSKSFVLFQVF
jgi:hypothetical protein